MDTLDSRTFTADAAWTGRELLEGGGLAARLLWTDQPYHWHANRGDELFVVLDGRIDMHYEDAAGIVRSVLLEPGQMATFRTGERHVAHPQGEARILVVERTDSD